MAQQVKIAGALFNDVPYIQCPDVNDVYHPFVDPSITTATESDVAQGKVFVKADGSTGTGTASGGGATLITKSITANGTYNASSDNADGYSSVTVNVSGGGGGLEYEMGTWTPASDIGTTTISFANTHSSAPFFYMISDASGTYSSQSSSNCLVSYFNYHQFTGAAINVDNGTTYNYANALSRYRSGATTISNTTTSITTPYTDSADTSTSNSRYWATETGIKAHSTSASRYWRSNRTYKWIAVWKPTS